MLSVMLSMLVFPRVKLTYPRKTKECVASKTCVCPSDAVWRGLSGPRSHTKMVAVALRAGTESDGTRGSTGASNQ